MQATQSCRQQPYRHSDYQTLNSIVVSIFLCAIGVGIGITFIYTFCSLVM
jgi:hypothetical protein